MNVRQFYTELFEQSLGLDVLGLEDRFRELVRLVETRTLTAFSSLIPAQYRTYMDLRDSKNIIKKDGGRNTLGVEYRISDPTIEKFGLKIFGIEKLEPNTTGVVDPYDPESEAYYSAILASRSNLTLESVLFGSEYTYNRTLVDSAIPYKRYHEYRGGNVLYLRNWGSYSDVEITCTVNWPNIVSIPEEYREVFMTLATLDIKVYLWAQMKYLENITLPTGNMDLKVDDWANADERRSDYLKELRNKSLADRVKSNFFSIL